MFAGDLDAVLERACEADVCRVLAVGSDLRTSHAAVALASRHEIVYAAVGVHPHESSRFRQEADEVRSLLTVEKVVAVGEIGLDYFREFVPREVQLEAFREQLQWARAKDLPASVHNRAADEHVLKALREAGARAVLHCFSGSWELARRAQENGLYLSFAGNVTYRRADSLREVAAAVRLDRLMVESDSPVLAPQHWRGKRNEPAYVRATVEALAARRGMTFAQVARAVTENADRVFAWQRG